VGALILMLIIVGVGVTVAAMKSGGNSAAPVRRAAEQRLGLSFEPTGMMTQSEERGHSTRIAGSH
jgi:hypothetical protein